MALTLLDVGGVDDDAGVDVDVGVADAELPALVASGAPSSSPSPSSS